MQWDDTAIRALEERAFNAWPALWSAYCDGWLLRFSEGLTRRANSVNALAPTGNFLETLDFAETLYGRLRMPTIFRLSPLAGDEPDGMLHRAGYRHDDETHVMTATLGSDLRIDPDVEIAAQPTPSWSTGFANANGISPAMRGVHDRMLASILMPAGYATVVEDGKPLAYGLAVVERGMVGLFDIVTVPDARRRGAGRLLVRSLLGWGLSQGATAAYLQVLGSNEAARGLYGGFGFQEAYRYHYRIRA
jgi:ribosomal protein S18 acetylase RimI-like enzyme